MNFEHTTIAQKYDLFGGNGSYRENKHGCLLAGAGAYRRPALSEESGSAIKSGPPVVSCGNLTPFGKGVRSAEFEVMAAAKMTFLVKMVVN